jgi:hypothetical protein
MQDEFEVREQLAKLRPDDKCGATCRYLLGERILRRFDRGHCVQCRNSRGAGRGANP